MVVVLEGYRVAGLELLLDAGNRRNNLEDLVYVDIVKDVDVVKDPMDDMDGFEVELRFEFGTFLVLVVVVDCGG